MDSHKFVWYDLMTTNTAAGTAFYDDVIGYNSSDSGLPGMEYTIFSMGDTMVGGLMAIPPGAGEQGVRPMWAGYVYVDDVDSYAKKAVDAGGTIYTEPADIPSIGRFAVVGDPSGAAITLFQPQGTRPDSDVVDQSTPGQVGWHELHTLDIDAALAFYETLFGWTKSDTMDMGPMGIYQLFAIGGVQAGGIMTKDSNIPQPFWLFYFTVATLDTAIEKVKSGGGMVLNGPMEVPGGAWIAQCIDPQGAMFAISSMTR